MLNSSLIILKLLNRKNSIVSFLKTRARAVADPGFSVGGRPVEGGADLRHVHFLAKTCENERIGSCWGGDAPAAPPGFANDETHGFMAIPNIEYFERFVDF